MESGIFQPFRVTVVGEAASPFADSIQHFLLSCPFVYFVVSLYSVVYFVV